MTLWIGLTGGIGSGKSQAAAEFLHFGAPVIDTDAISRNLTAENGVALPAIWRQFGEDLFDENACLKRAALRDLVFSCDEARSRLEALMHPLIMAEIDAQKIKNVRADYGIIEIPLLAEKPVFQSWVDRILVVECEDKVRLQRVMRRNGLSESKVKQIMAAQATARQRRAIADDVLVNNGSMAQLVEKVGRLQDYYRYLGTRCG